MKRLLLSAVFGVCAITTSCMGFGLFGKAQVGGTSTENKKTQIAGAIVEKVEATGVKMDKAEMKADLKATGADLSKKTSTTVGGDMTNDSGMIIHIFDSVMNKMGYVVFLFVSFLGSAMGSVFGILKFQSGAYNKTIDTLLKMIESNEAREDEQAAKLQEKMLKESKNG